MNTLLRISLGPIVFAALAACATPGAGETTQQDEARATAADDPVATFKALPGYAALSDLQRDALVRLMTQPTNNYSRGVRRDFAALMGNGSFTSASPADQAKQLWGIAHAESDFTKPIVDGLFVGAWPRFAQLLKAVVPAGNKPHLDPKPTIGHHLGVAPVRDEAAFTEKMKGLFSGGGSSTPVSESDYDLSGEEAAIFGVEINGERFTIGAPLKADGTAPDPKATSEYPADEPTSGPLFNVSVEETAQAIADMPAVNRRFVTAEVTITAKRAPLDAIFSIIQGRPDFRAGMLAGVFPLGSFGVFPQTRALFGPIQLDSLVHETGHAWSYKAWGTDPRGAGWQRWRAAIDADGIEPSWYASKEILDDVAETVLLYCAVGTMGADREAFAKEMKALFPHRWEILEREFPRE